MGIDVFAFLVGFLSFDARVMLVVANFFTLGILDFVVNFIICWFGALIVITIIG